VLATKLQTLFGWTETPTVGPQRHPVLIHLLSPAGRPLAVTRDLKSFWANAYPEVRKDMRGRYPKHPWPENPLTATASHRTKTRSWRPRLDAFDATETASQRPWWWTQIRKKDWHFYIDGTSKASPTSVVVWADAERSEGGGKSEFL